MITTIAILYITSLISELSLIYFYEKLSRSEKRINLKIIFMILLIPVIQVIAKTLGLDVIIPIISIFYFIVLFKCIFQGTLKETINYEIIIWTIITLLDVIMMLLINPINIEVEISKGISSIVLSTIIVILASSNAVLKVLRALYKRLDKINLNYLYLIITIVLFLIVEYLGFKNVDNKYIVVSALLIGIVLALIVVNFVVLYYEIITLRTTNEILEQSNEASLELISEYRILKHNLEHNLLGIKTVSNKKTKELIDALIAEYNSKFYIKHDITSMPAGINGFILEKFYKYAEEDLKITVENKIKKKILGLLGPRNYNLFCEALGVTLDNALESTVKSKEKLLYLEFKETEESLMATVANTFTGNIELDKLGTKEYTSRKTGHGLGLYSLFNRKNLFITTSIKNNLFINKIEVKKRKDN